MGDFYTTISIIILYRDVNIFIVSHFYYYFMGVIFFHSRVIAFDHVYALCIIVSGQFFYYGWPLFWVLPHKSVDLWEIWVSLMSQ